MNKILFLALSTILASGTGAAAGGLMEVAAPTPTEVVAAPSAPSFALPSFGLQDAKSGVNVGVSTLGFTVEPTVRLNERFGLRAPIGMGNFDFDEESDGSTYSGEVTYGGVGLLADYFPFQNGFHVLAGLFRTNYGADLIGENIEIDDETADIAVSIEQRRDISPALTIGYNGRLGQRLVLSASIGAIFGDGFDVTATESTETFTQEEIDEKIADIRENAADLTVTPFIMLAVGFRF